MKIEILRVIGCRAKAPAVVALADDYLVKWSPRDGWTCNCDKPDYEDCAHVDAIENLLDPRVTGATQ